MLHVPDKKVLVLGLGHPWKYLKGWRKARKGVWLRCWWSPWYRQTWGPTVQPTTTCKWCYFPKSCGNCWKLLPGRRRSWEQKPGPCDAWQCLCFWRVTQKLFEDDNPANHEAQLPWFCMWCKASYSIIKIKSEWATQFLSLTFVGQFGSVCAPTYCWWLWTQFCRAVIPCCFVCSHC